jgi:type VI secretion system secreted protein Hcp
MSADMFLKIEGIQGESVDSVHADEIDVLAWSWGMSQSGTMHVAAGGGSGKVAVQDLSITKYVDSASPNMMQKCCTGEHYPSAILTIRKAGADPLEYLVITMTGVLVTSISAGGSGGEDKLTENVTLNFAEFESVYTPQAADGSGGAAIDVAYNIAQNVIV